MYCYHWKLVVELHVRFTIRKILALQIVLHIMRPHRMYCTDTGIPDVHLATQSHRKQAKSSSAKPSFIQRYRY